MTRSDMPRFFRNSLRMYFAPVTGAIRGVHREMRRAYRIRNTEMQAAYGSTAVAPATAASIDGPTLPQK